MPAVAEPRRVQLRRTRGYRKPPNAVVVARPSRWGNEFAVGEEVTLDMGGYVHAFIVRDRGHAVNLYEMWQVDGALRAAARAELAGRDLACWCPLSDANGGPVPCHADVLLRLANENAGAHLDT